MAEHEVKILCESEDSLHVSISEEEVLSAFREGGPPTDLEIISWLQDYVDGNLLATFKPVYSQNAKFITFVRDVLFKQMKLDVQG